MFLEKAKKHFSVVTKVAEEAGDNIFKSVVSKSIDKGLVSHDPKVFSQKDYRPFSRERVGMKP